MRQTQFLAWSINTLFWATQSKLVLSPGTHCPLSCFNSSDHLLLALLIWFVYLFIYVFFRAAPVVYGGSQARDRVRVIAAGLHHSHSNIRSKRHLPPTPRLTAMLDP